MLPAQLNAWCQTLLQLREGCTPAPQALQTRLCEGRINGVVMPPVFVRPNHGESRHTEHCFVQKPSEDLWLHCFSGLRRCGQLAEVRVGFGGTPQLQAGERSAVPRALGKHASIRLYERKVLVAAISQFGHDALSFVAVRLTNLRGRFRNCSQNSVLRFWEFQSKSLPFRSPVTGL
jgi:hypothetical protein